MKSTLELVLKLLKAICPKSRWANVVYLILGYGISSYDQIVELIRALLVK